MVIVIFSVEFGELGDFAVERERGQNRILDGGLVDDGETAWHPEADGADVGIRRRARVIGRAAAKHFAVSEQLRVDFEANDRFKIHIEIISHFDGIAKRA